MASAQRLGTYGSRRGVAPTVFPPNSYLITKPIQKGIPVANTDTPRIPHGQNVYIYRNVQTDQIVYSLSRHLHNKDSLDQLPYLGKKTVPPRLRKDLWSPLAMVHFPSHHAGLAAYRKLREFKRLHETSYDLEDITEKEGKHAGSLYPKKKRGKILMNQKANSVADLAAVLWQQYIGPTDERKANADRRMSRVARLQLQKGEKNVKKHPLDVEKELEGVEGISVKWADMLDAEYAETWPEGVIHETLQKSRHTVAWPAVETVEEDKEEKGVATLQSGQPSPMAGPPKQGWRDWIMERIPGRQRIAMNSA